MAPRRTVVDPRTGRTLRSGLGMTPVKPHAKNSAMPKSTIYRAVVLHTYATDDPIRTPTGRKGTTRLQSVECDIVLTRSMVHYARVPVMQQRHGVNDADLWIPRPTTRVVGNQFQSPTLARVSTRGTVLPVPPNLADLDGDHVLVSFIEGDPESPIIVGSISHAKTQRRVVRGGGWSDTDFGTTRGKPQLKERYMHYRGVEVRINDKGDVLLDASGATGDAPSPNFAPDIEVANPLTGGLVKIILKPSQKLKVEFEGGLPGITLSGPIGNVPPLPQVAMLSATEPFVKGLALQAALIKFATTIGAAFGAQTFLPAGGATPAVTAMSNAVTDLTAELVLAMSLTIKGE